jgi:hypothetical protein
LGLGAGNLQAKRSLGQPGINGRIILKWISVNMEEWRGVD